MFDPEDFAKLAVRLVQDPCGHAESRTAISRAYYSTFLKAKQFLDPYFYFGRGAAVHDHVQMLYLNCLNERVKDIGRNLRELREKRNAADYDLNDDDVNSYHTARVYNGIGKKTLDELRVIFGSSMIEPTLAEMRAWAKASGVARAK